MSTAHTSPQTSSNPNEKVCITYRTVWQSQSHSLVDAGSAKSCNDKDDLHITGPVDTAENTEPNTHPHTTDMYRLARSNNNIPCDANFSLHEGKWWWNFCCQYNPATRAFSDFGLRESHRGYDVHDVKSVDIGYVFGISKADELADDVIAVYSTEREFLDDKGKRMMWVKLQAGVGLALHTIKCYLKELQPDEYEVELSEREEDQLRLHDKEASQEFEN